MVRVAPQSSDGGTRGREAVRLAEESSHGLKIWADAVGKMVQAQDRHWLEELFHRLKKSLRKLANIARALQKWEREQFDDTMESGEPFGPFEGHRWIALTIIILFVNSTGIAIETDAEGDVKRISSLINGFCLLLYSLEVLGRILMQKVRSLNTRTLLEVIFTVGPLLEKIIGGHVLRAVPILRLFWMLRSLGRRWKMVKTAVNFQVVMNAIERLRWTVTWAVLVLFLLLLNLAVVAQAVVGDSDQWVGSMDPIEEGTLFQPAGRGPFEAFDRHYYFGSVGRSFFTLLQVSTQSRWSDHVRPIVKVYPVTVVFFLFLFLTTSYGLLQIILGVMVCDVLRSSRRIHLAQEEIKLDLQRCLSESVLEVISKVDENRDGNLSAEEIDKALRGKDAYVIKNLLIDLGLPSFSLSGSNIVQMLDTSGDGCISYREFIEGVAQLQLDLVPRDWYRLSWRVAGIEARVKHIQERYEILFLNMVTTRKNLEDAFHAIEKYFDPEHGRGIHNAIMQKAKRYVKENRMPIPVMKEFREASLRRGVTDDTALPQSNSKHFMMMLQRVTGVTAPPSPRRSQRPASAPAGLSRRSEPRIQTSPVPPPPLGFAPPAPPPKELMPPAPPPLPAELPEPPPLRGTADIRFGQTGERYRTAASPLAPTVPHLQSARRAICGVDQIPDELRDPTDLKPQRSDHRPRVLEPMQWTNPKAVRRQHAMKMRSKQIRDH